MGDDEYIYYYDLWGNIHFGYVAKSMTFSNDIIIYGNTTHNLGRIIVGDAGRDDNLAVQLGVTLYDLYQDDLSIDDLHAIIFTNRLIFYEDTTRVKPSKLYL